MVGAAVRKPRVPNDELHRVTITRRHGLHLSKNRPKIPATKINDIPTISVYHQFVVPNGPSRTDT